MAKVLREADYIKKRKRKYLKGTMISLIIMMIIFLAGMMITKSRNNLFTLAAVLLTLVVAQYGVQFISIIKYKDGDPNISKQLEELPDSYVVLNSTLFGDQVSMVFFDHILITDRTIYCIENNNVKTHDENVKNMKRIMKGKGLGDQLVFIKSNEISKYINKWNSKEVTDLEQQQDFIDMLKSALI